MIVKNKLLNFSDKIIYQDTEWFNFSLDSVLLANFATIKTSDKKIIDFATGNAPIPMLLSYRTKAKITGIELQKEVYELAVKSVIENKMDEQISIINDDILNIVKYKELNDCDLILCNPPYFKNSNKNINDIKSIARHEIKINLEQIIETASKILKNGGNFALVHRPERLMEIIELFLKYNIQPKKLQFVYPKMNQNSNIVLIEGKKNGNKGLKVLKPLYIHDDENNYLPEIKKMFEE